MVHIQMLEEVKCLGYLADVPFSGRDMLEDTIFGAFRFAAIKKEPFS